jgi:hypothetical protein
VCTPCTFFLTPQSSDAHSLCWLQNFQCSVVHSLHSLKNPDRNRQTHKQIVKSIYNLYLQHTSDIQMHKHTQTIHGQEKLLFVLISQCLYKMCFYKNWTATESQFSPSRSLYLRILLFSLSTLLLERFITKEGSLELILIHHL